MAEEKCNTEQEQEEYYFKDEELKDLVVGITRDPWGMFVQGFPVPDEQRRTPKHKNSPREYWFHPPMCAASIADTHEEALKKLFRHRQGAEIEVGKKISEVQTRDKLKKRDHVLHLYWVKAKKGYTIKITPRNSRYYFERTRIEHLDVMDKIRWSPIMEPCFQSLYIPLMKLKDETGGF